MSARSFRPRLPSRRRAALLRPQPLSLAIAAALASSFATTGQAQPDELETIIVTATRRELSVQDIPLNIAAFDDSLLEAREISDLAELGRNVPGLYVIDQGKRSANNIVVRGLNLNAFQSAEFLGNTGGSTVATYVGEIPLYVDLTMTDIERVEVLLGPQGTLYGAGTLGGAIRYIPRKPEFDTSVSVRGSTFAVSESDSMGFRGGATFNVPFGDNLAFRASIDQYDDPGFIDTPYLVRESGVSDPEPDFTNPTEVAANLYRDDDVDWEETTGARAALRWQPGDNVDATFTYHYQNMEVGGRTQNHVAAFSTGQFESATRYPEPSERRNELLSAEIVADLGFAQLTSATGKSKYDQVGQRDQTDLLITLQYSYEEFPTFSAFTRETEKEETFTQEIRLVSQSTGAVNWIVGLFYNDFEQPDGVSREYTPGWAEYARRLAARQSRIHQRAVRRPHGERSLRRGQLRRDGSMADHCRHALLRLLVRSVERPGAAASRYGLRRGARGRNRSEFRRPRHPGRQRLVVQVQYGVSVQRRRAGILHDQRGLSNRRVERHSAVRPRSETISRTSARRPRSSSTGPTRRRTTRSVCAANGSTGVSP